MRYSRKFKARAVRQMVGPRGKSGSQLSKELGVAQSTLSKWLRDSVADVDEEHDDDKKAVPAKELNWKEKARLVLEADDLEDEELGAFLRSNGLHEADLEDWRAWLQGGPEEKGSKKQRQADRKRIKSLERELRKKDKALAETAALLVLKKKAQAIWGDEDDDTDTNSES